MQVDATAQYAAIMETSHGTVTIDLYPAHAPKTVNSFVFLARYHYYDGIIFHRIIPGFVCQGGDPSGNGTGGPGYKFEDELPKAGRYEIGSLAMANAGPNTNGSQFYITLSTVTALDGKYNVFGKVTDGQKVADSIVQGDKIVSITIAEK